MSDFALLDIFLYGKRIGSISNLPGDKNSFSFSEEYINDSNRPLLSLSFKGLFGGLVEEVKSTRRQLPPFFSNSLPEGALKDFLSRQLKVSSDREFYFLAALGQDLPGAMTASPSERLLETTPDSSLSKKLSSDEKTLHFSLAGVQLKFSAVGDAEDRLTIPTDGLGGSWIVKFPSAAYQNVPENEYAMMLLAREIGIEVPEIKLIPMEEIKGIPKIYSHLSQKAFVIKRFDRAKDLSRIHIEDFAQVFGVYPEEKYRVASYRNIIEVIASEIGEEGVRQFIQRFVFNALIGNGDMHLKNWSLIYADKIHPTLAPAYDFVSTLPYIPNDKLALTFVDSKQFSSLTLEQFKRFAAKAKLSETLVVSTLEKTVRDFKKIWRSKSDFPISISLTQVIDEHLKQLPIFKSL